MFIYILLYFLTISLVFGLDLIMGFDISQAVMRLKNPIWVTDPVEAAVELFFASLPLLLTAWPYLKRNFKQRME